ncbi:hypothetical protein CEXT_435761 [Caerostris extrusa]|uniref:Uncharacterized protein n=1 Tax=Caerostris extrusa TaxID=172846 RepID=A0AAV4Q596_CAEEX|nr:hypothetical protein CEXT_435761 [Caerostris extrusa]
MSGIVKEQNICFYVNRCYKDILKSVVFKAAFDVWKASVYSSVVITPTLPTSVSVSIQLIINKRLDSAASAVLMDALPSIDDGNYACVYLCTEHFLMVMNESNQESLRGCKVGALSL